MFSNALKSFTSNITSNYTLSPTPTSHSGPWKIYDAKKKKTGQSVSVFIFERKVLDSSSSSSASLSLRGSSKDGLKAAQDEVVERLKKEASLLARLRHPCVLELAEPVEETRGGGLMFATEPVMSSLAVLLAEKDEEEGRGGGRYVRDDGSGGRRRREVEIDELEIQKGLLQIGKGLEFLHESAALIHGNLTPESIMVNAKSDWKLTSFSFAVPSVNPPLPAPYDPRLPPFVQLSLDYASPDLILDQTLTPSADLFSLGLLIISLYNSPHRSPLETHHSTSTYRRLLSSASTTPNSGNNYLSSRPLPRPLLESLLPRLLTRRPAGRVTAREFQQSPYFDNILVSTLRFLDSLPAKTPAEKSAFMRGLLKVLPQFPRSVLEKKILPGLVEELRDGSMLALVLPNIFAIVENASARLFEEKVLGRLKEVFVPTTTTTAPSSEQQKSAAAKIAEREREAGKEGGLTVLLSALPIIKAKTTAKEFKDFILPIIHFALESPTHAIQDLALRSLSTVLPKLDFPTLKNELFPIVAGVFTKTSSLGIKIRALEAFKVLCGGGESDGLSGERKKEDMGPELDKYTIQEKVVPLLKGIKTKEPAVMMAALDVFGIIGRVCDREVVAMEVLPALWCMSFGPLLGLEQFQAFMTTIKELSRKIETEQTNKLQELSTAPNNATTAGEFLSFGGTPAPAAFLSTSGGETDFENLVFGRSGNGNRSPVADGFDPPVAKKKDDISFGWSTPPASSSSNHNGGGMGMGMGVMQPQTQQKPRSVTPDVKMSSFSSLTPSNGSNGIGMGSVGFGSTTGLRPQSTTSTASSTGGIDWSAASKKPSFASTLSSPSLSSTASNFTSSANNTSLWNTPPLKPVVSSSSMASMSSSKPMNTLSFPPPPPSNSSQMPGTQTQTHPTILYGQTRQQAAPSSSGSSAFAGFMIPPPPGPGTIQPSSNAFGGLNMGMSSMNLGGTGTSGGGMGMGSGGMGMGMGMGGANGEKKGLDKWESLL